MKTRIQRNADGIILKEGIFKDDAFQYTQKEWALPECPSSGYFHNCFGMYVWDDGNKYVGEWKDDKRDGQGTYTYANGDKYVGEFKDGKGK